MRTVLHFEDVLCCKCRTVFELLIKSDFFLTNFIEIDTFLIPAARGSCRFVFALALGCPPSSLRVTSLHFTSLVSLHFTLLPPLTSLTSLHFTSLHLNSFHSLHLTSLHFTSILLTPTGPGAQNRYFSKGFYIKNDTFSVPAAPGRLPRPAPALKTVIFQKDFKQKTILFQSRPLRATCSDRPWRSKRFPARV